jgi:uncharacterized protein (DUF342 family)
MPAIAKQPATDVALTRHFDELEARLETIEHRVKQLEVMAAELEQVKALAGDLKFELEQMRE